MIPFNKPVITGHEQGFVLDAMSRGKISGDGYYSQKCHRWFEETLGCRRALLTPSCTHALEMAAILLDIKENDEIIMPSYTFSSTANAFVKRGAKIVFVDIRPDTMNIDETLIEDAITERTRAIVPVHYAGVACEMNAITELAAKHGLFVIEDAAQAMMSSYHGQPLGTVSTIGAFSFHETKNFTSAGEGGLAIVNDAQFADRAEIIREKGTNRSQFFRGAVDKYSWVDIGSSYLMNEISAAFLWGQIEHAKDIIDRRLEIYNAYQTGLSALEESGKISLPRIPAGVLPNGHMFYIKAKNIEERTNLINSLKSKDIVSVFHYIPLHSSKAGRLFGRLSGEDRYTTRESEKLVRLPLFYNMSLDEVEKVVSAVNIFYSE